MMRPLLVGLLVLGVASLPRPTAASETSVPGQITLGGLEQLHPPVKLDHALHAEIAGDCASCHHQPFGEPEPCGSCHDEPVAAAAFVHELHWEVEDCTGCHHRPATTDLRCVSCHAIEPRPERLALIGLKGAYHGLCLRCHQVSGAGATCGPCHPSRTAPSTTTDPAADAPRTPAAPDAGPETLAR